MTDFWEDLGIRETALEITTPARFGCNPCHRELVTEYSFAHDMWRSEMRCMCKECYDALPCKKGITVHSDPYKPGQQFWISDEDREIVFNEC